MGNPPGLTSIICQKNLRRTRLYKTDFSASLSFKGKILPKIKISVSTFSRFYYWTHHPKPFSLPFSCLISSVLTQFRHKKLCYLFSWRCLIPILRYSSLGRRANLSNRLHSKIIHCDYRQSLGVRSRYSSIQRWVLLLIYGTKERCQYHRLWLYFYSSIRLQMIVHLM